MWGATFWEGYDPRSIEYDSMVSVGPSALSCVVPLRNLVLLAPTPPSTIFPRLQKGFNLNFPEYT